MPQDSDTNYLQLQKVLEKWSLSRPVSNWGTAPLATPLSLEFYKTWLDQGFHSTMDYLKAHLPQKAEPQKLGARLRSALVFTFPYHPHPENHNFPLKNLRTALYAQGNDYHFWIKNHLSDLVKDLHSIFPEDEFLVFTDSAPVLERDLAYRAGLGWVGKNTCLIDAQKGSLFLIGEIYTSLNLSAETKLQPDFCGKCTACIDICPTQAIKAPRTLDAGKCISFLTIESRDIPSEPLRSKIGDWFFGCDLCQTVCPWNQKVFKTEIKVQAQAIKQVQDRQTLIEELKLILTSSGKQLSKIFKETPLMRAGPFGLKRNALIVAANLKLFELEPEVRSLTEHEKLADLAQWTLKQFTSQVSS